jgi:hypothetical protein
VFITPDAKFALFLQRCIHRVKVLCIKSSQ